VFDHRVLQPQIVAGDDGRLLLGYQATNSRMTLGIAVDHVIDTELTPSTTTSVGEDGGKVVVAVDAVEGSTIRVQKFAAYQTSRSVPVPELVDRCQRTLERVVGAGFDAVVATQRHHVARFWGRADVQVEGDPAATDGMAQAARQQAIRWNIFQLGQAAWRAEGAGIPAKGLTGQAYDGQFFWDSEIYVVPFLTYTFPRIARNVLRFRHTMLDKARARARELSQRGALFPWRTINGDEASAYYQAGTAQYHINADIAYAIQKYVQVRDDPGFLVEVGASMLVETARLWEDLGFYGPDGRFSIHSVTGPDEYTTVVNDNAYTNLMARANLRSAAAAVRRLAEERPDDHRALVHEVGLDDGEVEAWERAADAMCIPYDEERGIHPQDESFLDREVWDLAATPRDRFPLLLHFHPLVIYRKQVLKQADVVLAMFLLGDEFSPEQKRRNFEYYDPLTTGDSSLSASVQSIVAAEIGDQARALEYFRYALMMDLADVAGNVSDGVHVASAGGAWMALVYGFGGMRDHGGRLSFDPRLPAEWRHLSFPLRFRGRQLRVELGRERHRFVLDTDAEDVVSDPLEITVRGEVHRLEAGVPLVVF
jgi:alpha,alpha-trehalose phosphorylase